MTTSPVVARRDQLGLTQAEAARRADVSLATWRRFETEPDTQLSDASLQGIARALKVSVSTLGWMREDPDLDVTTLPEVTRAHASEDWLAKLNESFDGYPMTPRQALAIESAARTFSDEEGFTWEDLAAGRLRLTQAAPFCLLPADVLLDTNDAWRSRLLDTFADIAERISAGRVPWPRCVAEEVALYLSITEAQEVPLEENFGPETVAQLDDHGADDDLDGPLEHLFQDHDFLAMWEDDSWLEDPTVTEAMGVNPDSYHPRNWWKRFANADAFDEGREG